MSGGEGKLARSLAGLGNMLGAMLEEADDAKARMLLLEQRVAWLEKVVEQVAAMGLELPPKG